MKKNMGFLHLKFIIIVVTLVREVLLVSHPLKTTGDEFCYIPEDTDCGPSVWPGQCQSGDRQSPIDVNYRRLGIFWHKTFFKFNPPYSQTHSNFFATNTGHSFRVQFSSKSDPMSDLTVAGGGLDGKYTFAQLHFHWGQRDDEGSEHTLMGRRFPLELHIVHYKSKYGSFGTAMDENDPEAVAVFAVLFELGAHNPAMESIVEAAKSPESIEEENTYVNYRYNLNVKKLFPEKMDFVRYLGSLTTPPCTQTVTWSIFTNAVSISEYQLNALRQLQNGEDERYFNFRPTQPINGRKLKFYKALGDPVFPVINSFFSKIKNFFWKVWKAFESWNHLLSFNVGKPLILWDESQSLWSHTWFLKSLFDPMLVVFHK